MLGKLTRANNITVLLRTTLNYCIWDLGKLYKNKKLIQFCIIQTNRKQTIIK